jgi:predicted PhzF superfamily epimerase YddE/YHI9
MGRPGEVEVTVEVRPDNAICASIRGTAVTAFRAALAC